MAWCEVNRFSPSVRIIACAHSQCHPLPPMYSKHNHWVTRERAACGATRHFFQGAIQSATIWVGGAMWGTLGVGVALVVLWRPTASAVLMAIMNVTKIIDCPTVQNKGQLKYVSVSYADFCESLTLLSDLTLN